MTNLQAAVGCAQMERLDALVAAKRRIAEGYDAAFADLPALTRFPCAPWGRSACWFSGVVVGDGAPLDAAALVARLVEAGIGARRFWKPMHRQAPYRESPRRPLPVTDGLWERVVTLPCSTGLGQADRDYVIETVRAAFARNAATPRRARGIDGR
jgi:dTDP-4-amino-4,6-dideoxygalactose transaminase